MQSPQYRRSIDEFATGTNINNLSKTTLQSILVPATDIETQTKIAQLLDRYGAVESEASAHLGAGARAVDRFRQAVLASACSGRLTTDWRETRGSVDTDGDVPAGWRIVELQELAAEDAPIRYGIVKPGPEAAGGVPYVRQQDVVGGVVLVDQLAHTSVEIANRYRRSALKEGDVLLGIIRNLRIALVPPGLDGANITQGMVRIRPRSGVEGRYLALYLESPGAQRWMHDRYVGLAMPRINVQDARVIPVPVPPHEEQSEIVKRASKLLSFADEVSARIGRAASNVDRSSQAVLAKAFRAS
jgi:type I restriction enzyme, S subunit